MTGQTPARVPNIFEDFAKRVHGDFETPLESVQIEVSYSRGRNPVGCVPDEVRIPTRFHPLRWDGPERLLPTMALRDFRGWSMKKGFVADIEENTRKNADFRRVLYTGKHAQFVLMRLTPGEEIGEEVHEDVDQFFRFEAGTGVVVIDGVRHAVKDGTGVIVPCGARHNVVNTSKTVDLKLYTIYSPPEHKDKVVRKTKQDAEASPEEYDGRPTE